MMTSKTCIAICMVLLAVNLRHGLSTQDPSIIKSAWVSGLAVLAVFAVFAVILILFILVRCKIDNRRKHLKGIEVQVMGPQLNTVSLGRLEPIRDNTDYHHYEEIPDLDVNLPLKPSQSNIYKSGCSPTNYKNHRTEQGRNPIAIPLDDYNYDYISHVYQAQSAGLTPASCLGDDYIHPIYYSSNNEVDDNNEKLPEYGKRSFLRLSFFSSGSSSIGDSNEQAAVTRSLEKSNETDSITNVKNSFSLNDEDNKNNEKGTVLKEVAEVDSNTPRKELYGSNTFPKDLYGSNTFPKELYGSNTFPKELHGSNTFPKELYGSNTFIKEPYGSNTIPKEMYGSNTFPKELHGSNTFPKELHGSNTFPKELYGSNTFPKELYGSNTFPKELYSSDTDLVQIEEEVDSLSTESGELAFVQHRQKAVPNTYSKF